MKNVIAGMTLTGLVVLSGGLHAAEYAIDKEGQHAFINFKINHLVTAAVNVVINTASVDSNHAERDKHLRSDDFLSVDGIRQ
jgi:polyisoprenoid-binding protein YceI